MQSSPSYRDTSYIPLGERRGRSDLARFSLDTSWASAVSDSARSRAYPSPPMSGSPPLPPRRNPDSTDRGYGSYGSSGQDVLPGTQTPQSDTSEPRGPQLRAYQPEQHPQASYSTYRMEDIQPTPPHSYQQRGPPIVPHMVQQQHPLYQSQVPQPPGPFPTADRPPTGEVTDYSESPKAQRKTKGHVASACVPCKRAHLRQVSPNGDRFDRFKEELEAAVCINADGYSSEIAASESESVLARFFSRYTRCFCLGADRAIDRDPNHPLAIAQRPCSRCLANGKEDACVDVQHKKRGRPRLRDEREQRYESMGPGYSHPQHDASVRRPLSFHSAEPSMTPAFGGDSLHRSGSYRVLKSQGPLAPRYMDHASSVDANMFGGSMPPAPRMLPTHEPLCAYLTMEMQIAKVTRSFGDTVGLQAVVGKRLQDIIVVNDREKVMRLQRILEDERRAREPSYLPPIFSKYEEDRIIQSVGFGPDEIGQLLLEHQELVTFQGSEGQQQPLQARFGLAKRESTYFIAVIFQVPATPQTSYQPVARDYPRESQYGYQTSQQAFPPGPSSFAPNPAYGDPRGDLMYRASVPNVPIASSMPPFSQQQTRPDYSPQIQNPYQTPRSELAQGQPQRQHDLQLPPIRDHRGEPSAANMSRRRDDRTGRLDIGGLLEQPRTTGGR
ncbi:hypothetical protein LSUB1_G006133 [Lachnellula subtilissima]|uniref:Uncharacterized protein n=1 Tax=Lachnellula subtilissima TaxID=602034 RepID=A0A8H8UA85_9HELO|nr:hypothetical protein LSUB1_G006133 [Lachnellula subtilissima]